MDKWETSTVIYITDEEDIFRFKVAPDADGGMIEITYEERYDREAKEYGEYRQRGDSMTFAPDMAETLIRSIRSVADDIAHQKGIHYAKLVPKLFEC